MKDQYLVYRDYMKFSALKSLYYTANWAFNGFLKFETGIEKTTAWFIILGTFLFSVSIYFLSFQDILKTNLKFIGPITPIGGLFMILGWALLIYVFAKTKF